MQLQNLISFFRNLTDISRLEPFVHLRFIDLSNNRLRTIHSLNRLKFLLTLKLDSNELSSFDLPPFPYLQTLSLSNNRLRSAAGIEQPRLEILNLNRMEFFFSKNRNSHLHSFVDNQIDTCTGLDSSKIPNLLTLEMRENRLLTTKGISLPNLKNLFLVKYSSNSFRHFLHSLRQQITSPSSKVWKNYLD